MPPTHVVVFGYGPMALAGLDTFEQLGVVPAAIVVPGNRSGANVEMVADRARARGWPLLVQPTRAQRAPFVEALRALSPDVLFVWSYTMLLTPDILAVPAKGAVNIHGGLLPEYRGGHVMNWAIANGERESGATLHYIDAGIDTGPVIAAQRFAIEPADDIATVQDKLRAAGTALLTQWWPAIAQGTAPRVPQDETRARYYRMRSEEDGRIDWSESAARIRNLVRALVAPWPGAHTWLGASRLVIRRVEVVDRSTGQPPGTIVAADASDLRVATGDGELRLLSVEIDGHAVDAARLWAAGFALGVRLT